jgi:hypothetical protein
MNIARLELPMWVNNNDVKSIRRINARIDLIMKILEDNGLYEKPPPLPFTETALVTRRTQLNPHMKEFLMSQRHKDEMALYRMMLRDSFGDTRNN